MTTKDSTNSKLKENRRRRIPNADELQNKSRIKRRRHNENNNGEKSRPTLVRRDKQEVRKITNLKSSRIRAKGRQINRCDNQAVKVIKSMLVERMKRTNA